MKIDIISTQTTTFSAVVNFQVEDGNKTWTVHTVDNYILEVVYSVYYKDNVERSVIQYLPDRVMQELNRLYGLKYKEKGLTGF